jgi:hypothetical protein
MGIFKQYERIEFRGKTLDRRTVALILLAEKRLGFKLSITQGSYNASVEQSGGTHDGGGAVDFAPVGGDIKQIVLVLRRLGAAAWFRPELWRDGKRIWGPHIHMVMIDHRTASPAAKDQIVAYRAGRNGLAGGNPDDGPRVRIRPFPYRLYFRVFLREFWTARVR